MNRVIFAMAVIISLTLGAFPAFTLGSITKDVAAACSDKDKGTSGDKGEGEQT